MISVIGLILFFVIFGKLVSFVFKSIQINNYSQVQLEPFGNNNFKNV